MDLQVDPYFVDPEGEDNDLFGDARGAVASTEAAAAESNVEHRAAEDAETETAEARFLPAPWSPFNPKRKTTVPPGTSRFETGAASACAREAPVNNTEGGVTDETSVCSRSITSTWTRQENPSHATRWRA